MSDDGRMRIDPINTKEYESGTYVDEYTYGQVFIEDIPEDFNQTGVDFRKGIDFVRWQYKNKPAILIGREKIFAKEGVSKKEAQNQAYFALSILSDDGYVSRFQKK